MFTNRTRATDCPLCYGSGGEVTWRHTGMYGAYGPEPREDFEPCEACGGHGTVERVNALAWAIGQEWAREAEARARVRPVRVGALTEAMGLAVAA